MSRFRIWGLVYKVIVITLIMTTALILHFEPNRIGNKMTNIMTLFIQKEANKAKIDINDLKMINPKYTVNLLANELNNIAEELSRVSKGY